ncbi:phosphate ABC transporter permease protein PstA [Gottschalkia acidurici 9a]|uniref:Phosphate ABC transporter permease protein PstA n=1 Tax=Gottschalkia acidurici (strain ATCC 7906 / DSM 604 / BCRC 14475 / CIP 104303 / KCTC 5404 / NCIMB 10678 / 9a) TaxID=1128398 RepID=K0AY57_GOTA9|nr:ABC transporter permease subunit [Gottschalkia acidurici]AFS78718.1 phosphate ABC transporter permease protein PstA [Gottschalkia acidurici 9a]
MIEKVKEYLFKIWITLSILVLFIAISYVIIYIIKNGINSISLEFIFDNPKGFPLGSEGGIFPAIVGSLLLMTIACIFSSILAISTAIYIVFYCESKKIESLIHMVIQCMAGIPSIILGLFGYTLLVLYMRLGRSALAGGITLGIMILPYIQVRIEKILREVDINIINSSYVLGISKYYMIFKLILPICKENIISTITLAGSFAIGASAPIILTAAVISAPVPNSIHSPVMALPFHLYILTGEGISLENSYATSLVLIMIVLVINIISVILFIKKKGR